MRAALAGALVLAGCSQASEGQWIRDFDVSWNLFNHRVSHLGLRPGAGGLEAVFVGGASTTGVVFDETDACIGPSCQEFPFTDASTVDVRVQRVSSEKRAFGAGSLTLQLTADGAEGEAVLTLDKARGPDLVAVIAGFYVDATTPLPEAAADLSCYDPRHGWHLTELGIELGEPARNGTEVRVPVTAFFGAGPSDEAARACTDAVVRLAGASITVDVVAIAGSLDRWDHERRNAVAYAYNGSLSAPPEQPPPSGDEVASDITWADGMFGWKSLHWWFNEADGRGAYLRSFHVLLDPELEASAGWTTNYSPATQLSGHASRFFGTWTEIAPDQKNDVITLDRYVTDALPATVDATSGEPTFTTLDAQ